MATANKSKAVAATADSTGALPDIPPTHLVVRATVNGFRRAGRAWSSEETTVPIDAFTEQQVEALLAEPGLVVVPMLAPEEG